MYKVAVVKKFYVHEIAAVNLSKIYFLKNAKKTCKPNNRDLNRDWKKQFFKHWLAKELDKWIIMRRIIFSINTYKKSAQYKELCGSFRRAATFVERLRN